MRNWLLSLSVGLFSLATTDLTVAAPDQLVSNSTELASYSVKHIKPILQQDNTKGSTELIESTQDALLYPSLVDYLYSRLDAEHIWSGNELNAQLNLQLDMMKLAGFSPLFQSRVELLQRYYQQGEVDRYDRVATDTFLLYLSYVAASQELGKEWYFTADLIEPLPRPSATEVDLMVKAFEAQEALAYITSFASPMLKQDGFENAYIDLVSKSQMTKIEYQQVGLTRLGDTLPKEAYLILLERLSESNVFITAREDQYFDESLDLAIREFQTIYGLNDDGIIGPNTIEWLNKSASDKLRILALNSERSRLWPQQRENIIVVNVPNFQLEYWDEGEERFESRVIVGRTSRQTPLLETNMDSLILNPTWNVPWKIMVKDIIPKVKQNPTYLFSQRIEILEDWNNQARIDPTMINWQEVNARRFPYRMRQQAGELNALGQYKFNTPNAQAIFLHDTPSKHLFDESLRAFSSGCVRVEHADQFAQVLLEAQGKTLEDVATDRPNKAIALKQRIPVHIIYQTAWMSDGKAHFRGDVYQYDAKRESMNSAAFSKN
ncbi:L,D-transpeptidase family protein [Vibrio mediterranei]|jgi:murein L,D-transpeptidase YcbB/YkuD|uniref:L,D-transpeptidase family protein n=1 Tax=Vibrio mediterranei TaxID=689 RepID=UPI0007807211|nr:L,D-transpeptidase family protein [Vibrio mediterranei]MCG9656656.1 L,D-transpeptidase family protein [Vibrio mediterranei]MCG9662008.1 L,D-transpeptidase family protein [Vibrio mediterranei]PTC03801.1 murein L,D-transpeptidase [Vibrio mediterranei]SBO09357.1 murein L,D-transpeptidase [Vibrio mediterranei]